MLIIGTTIAKLTYHVLDSRFRLKVRCTCAMCCLTVRTFLHVTIEILLCGQRSKYVSHVCFLVLFSEQDGRKLCFKVSPLHWQYVSSADVYNLIRVDGNYGNVLRDGSNNWW